MLKESWKQTLVLSGFCLLLYEVLTGATLSFVALGIGLIAIGKRPGKYIRNFLAIAVFASYWLKYGKIIDPEIGLNFLTSIIVLKMLEKETVRDRYMIFFGLLLLISAGSLFERTLTYVIFFAISFLFLIFDFYSYLGQRWKLRELALSFFWVLPLTFFLFFFVPRLLNPIPFQQNTMGEGEIGYTPDVNISQIDTLQTNQSPVFHVSVSKELMQSELYWRGNTLSFNDGWNWKEMLQDKEGGLPQKAKEPLSLEIVQKFRLFIRPEYFFTLDYPRSISYGNKSLNFAGTMRTVPQSRWNWVQRYSVFSDPADIILDKEVLSRYLQVPLSRAEKERLDKMFPGSTMDEVKASLRSHFLQEGFSYSLSPGKTKNLKEFLEKKVGLCSHYASTTALIMRIKGIPTRLVSGFMGGNYNPFADFYLVSQNDAHVWVEALSDGKWQRLDPTEWIAPDRVRLGGEAFMETVDQGVFKRSNFFRIPPLFQDMKLWFQQWDFLFYQWLEEMDYHAQEVWFSKFNFKRKWVFTVIPILILIFMLLYMLFLNQRHRKSILSEHQELWFQFFRKMEKKGVILSKVSISDSEKTLHNLNNENSGKILDIWNELRALSFQDSVISTEGLRKKIKRL